MQMHDPYEQTVLPGASWNGSRVNMELVGLYNSYWHTEF